MVQSSPIRCFSDAEYADKGIEVVEHVDEAEVLIGVKEVPVDQLIPSKTYLFFSHTFKKQPYNRALLRAILEKNIRLIDYELLTAEKVAVCSVLDDMLEWSVPITGCWVGER